MHELEKKFGKLDKDIAKIKEEISKQFEGKILEQGKIIQAQESKITTRLMMELSYLKEELSDQLGKLTDSQQKRDKNFDIQVLDKPKVILPNIKIDQKRDKTFDIELLEECK